MKHLTLKNLFLRAGACLLLVCLLCSLLPAASAASGFVDVGSDRYYTRAVAWAVKNGITGGTDETHFSPDAPCTRAQVVTFLWRSWGSPNPTSSANPFVDVKKNAYYLKAVLWAVEHGIVAGTDATHFSPDATCTRAQVVTILWRSWGGPNSTSSANPFVDVKKDAYYLKAVLWAVEHGIVAGTDATHFSPKAPCTRAQVVTLLWRMNYYQNENATPILQSGVIASAPIEAHYVYEKNGETKLVVTFRLSNQSAYDVTIHSADICLWDYQLGALANGKVKEISMTVPAGAQNCKLIVTFTGNCLLNEYANLITGIRWSFRTVN